MKAQQTDKINGEYVIDPFTGEGEWFPFDDDADEELQKTTNWKANNPFPSPKDTLSDDFEGHEEDTTQETILNESELEEWEKQDEELDRVISKMPTSKKFAFAKELGKQAKQERIEAAKDNPDYKPIRPLEPGNAQDAISLVLSGMSADQAFEGIAEVYGYTEEEKERVRKFEYYNEPKARSWLLEPFNSQIRALTRKGYLRKKHINHKQAPTLLAILKGLEDAVVYKHRVETEEKRKKIELSESFDRYLTVDSSEMCKPQLKELAASMKQAGFTYIQIGDKLGKSEKTIRSWLKNTVNLNQST